MNRPLGILAMLTITAALQGSALAQENGTEVRLRREHHGQRVELDEQHELVVELPAMPQTGYGWYVVEIDSKKLRHLKTESMNDAQQFGGEETHRVRFGGLAAGDHLLKLEYRRPFDPPSTPPLRTFYVHVHTKGGFTGTHAPRGP